MYISLSTESAQQSLMKLQRGVVSVFNWITQTKLNLNLIGSEYQRKKI